MFMPRDRQRRIQNYRNRFPQVLTDCLGGGVHGTVFLSIRRSAIKIFDSLQFYQAEKRALTRFLERGLRHICGHNIPQMIGCDDEYLAIEMTIVARPSVLDFAATQLDIPPDFSPEVMADWEAEKSELFGDKWPEVLSLLASMAAIGVYHLDVAPRNIQFAE